MKGRDQFSKSEAAQIKELLDQKIKSGNLKYYRRKLRSFDFFSDDFKRVPSGFSPQDFDELVQTKRISIINDSEMESQHVELKTQGERGFYEIRGFPPIASETSKVLILGTVPGAKSLDRNEYYAETRNKFWFILEEVFGINASGSYQNRINGLKLKQIAIWDVLMSCERRGSLDKNIRNAEPNDFEAFFTSHQAIEAIFFNGQKPRNYYQRLVLPGLSDHLKRIPLITLPSSSGAYAKSPTIKADVWEKSLKEKDFKNR